MYAYFKRLDYFSTECLYAPFAARGFAREFVKDLEVGRVGTCETARRLALVDMIHIYFTLFSVSDFSPYFSVRFDWCLPF